jgi:hypothetical protein
MNNVVRLAIVDPNDTSRGALKNLLLGIDMVWLDAECSRYEIFVDVVNQAQPDIALVSVESDPQCTQSARVREKPRLRGTGRISTKGRSNRSFPIGRGPCPR